MTTLAILADIHGNLPALEAVLADLAQFKVDHVIVAGDVINWGPFSGPVLDCVLDAGWAVIRGNNEFYLLDYETPRAPAAWHDRSQWPLLPWLRRQISPAAFTRIAAWPDSLSVRFPDAPPVLVIHGSPRSNTESIYPRAAPDEVEAMLAGVEETTVIAAHTHLPLARQVGRWQLFNPGSVGVPLDGVFCARYLLLEARGDGWRPAFRQVPIDPAPVLREFERQGFVEECGVVGRLVVEEFRLAHLMLYPFVAWRDACHPGQPLGPELLDEFARVDWNRYAPEPYRLGTPGG